MYISRASLLQFITNEGIALKDGTMENYNTADKSYQMANCCTPQYHMLYCHTTVQNNQSPCCALQIVHFYDQRSCLRYLYNNNYLLRISSVDILSHAKYKQNCIVQLSG